MTLIDRLLMREVFKALLVTLLILMLVLLASHFVKLLGKAAAGNISPHVVLSLLGLQAIKVLGVLLPPAFFFSLLWVLGGMYRDGEMVALQAAGVGPARFYRSVMLLAVPLALLTAILSFEGLPWANAAIERIKLAQRDVLDIGGIRPGRFNDFDKGRLVIYTRGMSDDGRRLQGVFVRDRQHGRSGIVVAREAYQAFDQASGDRFVILADGRRYEGRPGQADYAVATFGEYALRLPRLDLGQRRLRVGARATDDLWRDGSLPARAEIQYRLSVPTGVLVFALLAVPLARTRPRGDVYGRVGLAVLVYFVFMNLQRVAERWMELGVLPAWLGMWWVALVMIGIGGLVMLADSFWLAGWLRRWRERRAA
ncbi:LPS export ABC transporter permease LptF [endosymbiont of unidentified scaly snail isolate Monju]|uniref:LPS export ABC transporter permease LptF n=1 Tax=endosymbiont of unidentified scaly snail isolate Monju TaxID=1248727 RepID=UPI0003891D29|nr:LPS export ABC transporter permease LptF [endosymbiont of unidentified scaly snail isolate Monju]BAN69362.1 lipopolysaccharide export system permease protein [endosymbiont of unidentified scaly snail isolate Monju]